MAFLAYMNFINLQITPTFSIEMSFLQALKGLQLVLSPMENEMEDDDVQVIAGKVHIF